MSVYRLKVRVFALNTEIVRCKENKILDGKSKATTKMSPRTMKRQGNKLKRKSLDAKAISLTCHKHTTGGMKVGLRVGEIGTIIALSLSFFLIILAEGFVMRNAYIAQNIHVMELNSFDICFRDDFTFCFSFKKTFYSDL